MIPYRSMLDKGKTRDGYVKMLPTCWYDIVNYTVDNRCRLPNYDVFVLRIKLFYSSPITFEWLICLQNSNIACQKLKTLD